MMSKIEDDLVDVRYYKTLLEVLLAGLVMQHFSEEEIIDWIGKAVSELHNSLKPEEAEKLLVAMDMYQLEARIHFAGRISE
jgi:hypothetical protein